MKITEKEKAKNRAKIVAKAAKLFRERGLRDVGIADLMKEAGFTHGGFYNHFESKEALAAEVCASSIAHGNAELAAGLAGEEPDLAYRTYVASYLSPEHRDGQSALCVVAALIGDTAHEAAQVQTSMALGNEEFFEVLGSYFARRYRLDAAAGRRRAIETWAQIQGAIALSRAIVLGDRALADEILAVCREKLSR